MHEKTDGNATIPLERHTNWLDWVGRHPGVVLLGALLMAVLTLEESPPANHVESDTSDEEVPLFI